jgi:hypothetical protein
MAGAPLARNRQLVVETMGDELLVFDRDTNRAHSLNAAAAAVWMACDGTCGSDQLAVRCGLDVDAVDLALGELARCDLLDGPWSPTTTPVSRRAVLRRAARTGAVIGVTLPVVRTIIAPTPALAVSTCANPHENSGQPCTSTCQCAGNGAHPCCCSFPNGGIYPAGTKKCFTSSVICTNNAGVCRA